jgi:hypothetical protein
MADPGQETLESRKHMRDWGLEIGEKLTRPFKRSSRKRRHHRPSFVDGEATAPLLSNGSVTTYMATSDRVIQIEPPSAKEIFGDQTIINLISYTFLALHSVTYDQILTVFLNYPRQIPDENNTRLPFYFSGGFGLSSDKIGTIYTVYGVACGLIQFLLFPALCKRFGVLNCFRAASTLLFLRPPAALCPIIYECIHIYTYKS